METLTLRVNGDTRQIRVDPDTPLLYILRNDLGLTGAKFGCGLEQCGACKVLVDGAAVYSCVTPVAVFRDRAITTIEGLGGKEKSSLHPLQAAFVAHRAAQCGYCIPAIIIAAKALLDHNPRPGEDDICAALQDHLCRCGSHARIVDAIKQAAREMRP